MKPLYKKKSLIDFFIGYMTLLWPPSGMNLCHNAFLSLNPPLQTRTQLPVPANIPISHPLTSISPHFNSHSLQKPRFPPASAKATTNETLSEILDSSRAQKLDLELKTLEPFFRITARSVVTDKELGKAEGFIRFWVGGKILHLDSIKLQRETLDMEKSIFGLGLFIGAVAIRHGYDSGCKTAQLLAINDSDLYHSKVLFSPTLSKTSHLFIYLWAATVWF